ncbi:glutamine synthetase [Anaerostipes sp. 494a]|uniref:glutamine synthetase III family protein n=1 Tax=Anaerostipes sp. 494a TaxID=1261636 RepID=UPI000950F97E|nr:glutamine synthetase III [Anaerostipes sp. 494a]MDY2727117.1 glutamine synthetase III [Anaerostipes faecalis]OLR60206.1 glutamine synthetase [Anaerostipes sp. 494a]
MKEKINVAEIFGSNVFNDSVMKARLPKAVYKDLKKTIEEGTELNPAIADVVANEMKEWAIEKGATHYTHWFQPMTGVTAEKHDAFINPTDDGKVLLEFSGKELIKGEPDASSFPSGGLRATFEARGYTAWDCTSPAFIKETPSATILCIPTAFCSYKGEALDKKTPLLRSMQALDIQATRLLHLLGNESVKKVNTSVGPEQEYFLVDEEKYRQRKDLIFTGRTLFGAMPPKGQEMDDHYFGIIKPRIEGFMRDLNIEAWKLGISAKTEHNEVAPAQHELAPIYDSNNVATDHNQLLMETMRRVARRHGLKCLLHEKPFAGINGSGKHNNWSMVTNEGKNLLDPGKTPHENQQFLLILATIIKAVDEHADLLRMSASTPGNDHRLGANEAPPAIISIFLGEQLEDVVKQLVTRGEATSSKKGDKLASGVHSLPEFEKDATDRNRTSPFAFTGNKFEFRMVGSTQSISDPNVVLNTIVADAIADVCDKLEKVEGGADAVAMEAHELTKQMLTDHQRVIFNGNGYSDEWVEEAERRGLPNLKSMVDAIPTLVTDKSVEMFEKFGVFTKDELESRAEILFEQYAQTINIEALATLDIAKKQIVPAVMKYQKKLADSVSVLKETGVDTSVQEDLLADITENLKAMFAAIGVLEADTAKAQTIDEAQAQARFYHDTIFTEMNAVREPADKLEMLVAKEDWPFPSYGDLIFEV